MLAHLGLSRTQPQAAVCTYSAQWAILSSACSLVALAELLNMFESLVESATLGYILVSSKDWPWDLLQDYSCLETLEMVEPGSHA